MQRKIGIIGSTGSIGQNACKLAESLSDEFTITTLAAKRNIDLLEEQTRRHNPKLVAVFDETAAETLQKRLPHVPVLGGMEGVIAAACHEDIDLLLSAISGFDGVLPTLRAIEAKKNIALANKEALVAAGSLVTNLVKQKGVQLIPVDSEHTALFQCLKGESPKSVRKLILTASGGPFHGYCERDLTTIEPRDALRHPNYQMGAKVTIDSSTLMNKGLEIIEAHYLYDMPVDQIEVIVHPEQVIHSLVEFIDGSILAQMGEPDMLIPIQYALTYPKRYSSPLPPFSFLDHPTLTFTPPDLKKFPCLDLAYTSLHEGGSMPCFMNAANEVLVDRFLKRQIGWSDIGKKLEILMKGHRAAHLHSYSELIEVDKEARHMAGRI